MNNHTTKRLLLITVTSALASMIITLVSITHLKPRTSFINFSPTPSIIRVSDSPESELSQPETTPTIVEDLKTRVNRIMTTNLKKVYQIARSFGHPETMQAILLQESGGGVANPVGNLNSPVGKRSYGIMQVQVVAARSILTRYPDIFAKYFPNRTYTTVSDEEIIAMLITNDEANIHIATQHFKLYLDLSKGDWHKAVAAYNMGIGNANKRDNHEEYPYVQDVKRRIQEVVKPFNRRNGLPLTVSG